MSDPASSHVPMLSNPVRVLDVIRKAAHAAESDAFSRDLKRRGFSFVGSTVIYAHMQAVGMVNDHSVDCFQYRDIRRLAARSGASAHIQHSAHSPPGREATGS